MLTIAYHHWDKALKWFSDEELLDIHLATTGSVEQPRGFIVDESKLSETVRAKVKFHFVVRGQSRTAAGP